MPFCQFFQPQRQSIVYFSSLKIEAPPIRFLEIRSMAFVLTHYCSSNTTSDFHGPVVGLWWACGGLVVGLWWACGGPVVSLWWACGGPVVHTEHDYMA